MVDSELLISINADVKGVSNAYKDVTKQTEDLQGTLDTIAKGSGIAFAALSAIAGEALSTYSDSEQASNALTQSLQNQGIYTDDLKEAYAGYAESVQKATGYSAVQVTAAQAVLQSQIGQIPITQKLTSAIADLAAKQGIDLPSAAKELGLAIGNGTGQLIRMGLSFAATDTEADRLQKTLDFVSLKAGGAAEAANQAGLGIKGLTSAFEDSSIQLGEKFAPAARIVIKALTDFIEPVKGGSEAFVDFKAVAIAIGLALSGIGIALPLIAQGFLTVRAAAIALELGAAPLIAIPAVIALAVAALTELALNWDYVSTHVKAIVAGLVTFVSDSFSGLGKVLKGAFTLDSAKIEEGLNDIKKSFGDTADSYKESLGVQEKALEKHETVQDATKKSFADKAEATRRSDEANKNALLKAQDELIEIEIKNASAQSIALKKEEIAELTALTAKKQGRDKELLTQELAETRKAELAAHREELEQNDEFNKLNKEARENLTKQELASVDDTDKKEIAKIKASIKTKEDITRDEYKLELQNKIKSNNTFLAEQSKYGTAYAAINQVIHDDTLAQEEKSSADLAQLTQSSNSTLKAIGKVFSIENIIIKTATSAMNIYAGFSQIPIVGPALGIAGAAAAVAFGGEQIAKVQGAQAGGIVEGVGSGDRVPFMLEPGELIAPKQNFDEVINSVAAARSGSAAAAGGGSAEVQLSFKGNIMDFIETQLVRRKNLGFSIQGGGS